ncbi:MAG TPA: FmdB family zinc ribbon protein [Thermomicrobiaceae bacterium]|nr:FmdB family zinc ribbon protein [Thermomicrobiaceae bacterium]
MPLYEYACESCGHRFEIRQHFSDEPVTICPECGATVHRVLHPAGIIFKGSGWYITDSRKSQAASVNGESNGSDKKSESATTKPESKSETKAETSQASSSSTAN